MMELNIKSYCNCHARGVWMKQDGYTLDPPSGLWVHTRCRKPSQMNYMRNILGLPQIPQPRKNPDDIYDIELRQWARREIAAELGWDEPMWVDESNGWKWDE